MINLHKVWERAWIELAIPGSAIRLATDCATGPDMFLVYFVLVGSIIEHKGFQVLAICK